MLETGLSLDLDGYHLWPDGTISVTPSNLKKIIIKLPSLLKDGRVFVTEMTPEVEAYNALADQEITIKTDLSVDFPPKWNIPSRYSNIDLDEYLISLVDRIKKDDLYEERLIRLAEEISLFKNLQLEEILKTLIFIIEEFQKQNVVWGVGRGSSCSSYLLHLIGLHEVDPVKYDINISDFLRQ